MIGISPEGYVGHVYYGEYLEDADAYYLLRTEEPPFTPSVNEREKSFIFRLLSDRISVRRSGRTIEKAALMSEMKQDVWEVSSFTIL